MSQELSAVTLNDKYEIDEGTVLISGTQALLRLPLIQREVDQRAGLNTAGYISGYRGSPLGNYDLALAREKTRMEEAKITFQPGINEEAAATSVWGTQQIDAVPDPAFDGVFAIWYGKGPGVDRAGDALKHGNYAGSHVNGGVLVVYGDDHPGKSSSIAHQSEQALAANQIPSLYPSNVQEILEYGLLGWALSRYSGSWVGIKTVNETVEQTATVDIDASGLTIERPPRDDMGGVNYQTAIMPPQMIEMTVKRQRLPLVHRFVRANNIDRNVFDGTTFDGTKPGLGIVTAGKSYQDVLQALSLLGIGPERARQLGLGLYKVGCIWPLEPEGLTEFATQCQELLFIEEKSAIIQPQAAEILYNQTQRPRIVGKYDEAGTQLFPSDVMLDAREIATVIGQRLVALELIDADLQARITELSQEGAVNVGLSPAAQRTPYFCSGCPHNTSTKVPEGSNALAGIGCHTMAMFNEGYTIFPTQMGGEGLNWCGMSHFTNTRHVFQNLGDGTYYHSGLLAIRGAIASGANITYKILFNDATAMTGGQPADGPISVADITYQVLHEGTKKCVVLSDTPEAYTAQSGLAEGVQVYHRDELDRIQRELREIPGCTVLIYEQTCAAEKRRRRKRGKFPDPAKRLFINDAVCEGCSDCSVQSTCVSIMPRETPMGTRRRIDQSSCNKDYSCVKGFCPSFVTVTGAEPRKRQGKALDSSLFDDLPVPVKASVGEGSYDIMIAGIGGTGVITVGALLGMAAHMEGRACSIYDMTGLSQKNGAVYSHLRIADSNDVVFAQRMGKGDADLLLGFDLVAALQGDAAPVYAQGHTQVIGNAQVSTTSGFQFDPNVRPDTGLLQHQIIERVGEGNADFIDATGMALSLLGNTIGSNLFLMGYAAQRGLIPVGIDAIARAVELNGIAIEFNLNAFNLGRLLAHSPAELLKLLPQNKPSTEMAALSLDELIDHRSDLLTQYQNSAYAGRYVQLINTVRSAEQSVYPESEELTRAVAHGYAKLLAYKDEYEVARLYADPAFMQKLKMEFEDGYKLRFNLAPPLISKRDPQTGNLIKREFGGWLLGGFKILAKFKGLRGGALDIFGYSAERRGERQLISDYEQLVSQLLGELNEANYSSAVQLASLPEEIRGYGHVKEANIEKVKLQQQELLTQFKTADNIEKIPVALVAS